MLSSRLGGHGAISRSEPNTASTRAACLTRIECCHWTCAHHVGLREVRNSQPVDQCHPLIQPLLSLFPGPSAHHPTDHSADGVVRLAGYLGVLLPRPLPLPLPLLYSTRPGARRLGDDKTGRGGGGLEGGLG